MSTPPLEISEKVLKSLLKKACRSVVYREMFYSNPSTVIPAPYQVRGRLSQAPNDTYWKGIIETLHWFFRALFFLNGANVLRGHEPLRSKCSFIL